MRTLAIILSAFVLLGVSCRHEEEPLKIITFNIRYDNPSDGINEWHNRKDIVVEFIRDEQPGLFGLQEALWHQYNYIDSMLTGWGSIAVGRDDGLRQGEMAPVFYREDLFRLEESGTFWLSETPEIAGSRGWGAVLPRIVTWANLTSRLDGSTLYFFNTHFSHMSDSARIMSSRVLRKEVSSVAGNNNYIVTGDFNMLPESRAYAELVSPPIMDSYFAPGVIPEGSKTTFNGFRNGTGDRRIDYIFVKNNLGVLSHKTLTVKRDSVFISDHWPVEITLVTRSK